MRLPANIRTAFPSRPADLHKYSAGTVAVVGGSRRFAHAPAIAGLGARAGGAGLVHLVVPDASRVPAAALVPEATILKQTPTCVPPKADVTAIGMGLGLSAASSRLVFRLISSTTGRFVLDADALSILAGRYAGKTAPMPSVKGRTLILTPHAGEAARLLGCSADSVQSDRLSAVRRLAERYGAIVVLKGRHTLVASPDRKEVFECKAGNPFMATGGMGDLLGGAIAARWAYLLHRMPAETPPNDLAALAASGAVWLHAAASDALVRAKIPEAPSLVNTARMMASMRVQLERNPNRW